MPRCRKKRYKSYSHALRDSRQLKFKQDKLYQVYQCRNGCDAFHVGSLEDLSRDKPNLKKRKKRYEAVQM